MLTAMYVCTYVDRNLVTTTTTTTINFVIINNSKSKGESKV